MENVTDALYTAFAVLAFVVALSVSIVAFGQVRVAATSIIDARDKTISYTYVEPSGVSRTVTREDIIPTLYRAYKEDYSIRFEGLERISSDENLFILKTQDGDQPTNKIEPKQRTA